MKSVGVVLAVVAGVVILGALSLLGIYNGQIGKDEAVNQAWGNVEAQYQRRSDLIPNLVSTVKAYAAHEKETFLAVTEARKQVTNLQIDSANGVDASEIQQFAAAQGQLTSALSRLLVTVERYPELKATENFQALQHQLEGTENRISVARQDYNSAVRAVNSSVRMFPGSLVAGFSGVEKREPFKADEGSDQVPEVSFN